MSDVDDAMECVASSRGRVVIAFEVADVLAHEVERLRKIEMLWMAMQATVEAMPQQDQIAISSVAAGVDRCVDGFLAVFERQKAEVERLQAIVERIPADQYTADGVPVVTEGQVFLSDGRVAYVESFGSPLAIIKHENPDDDEAFEIRECYSTPEAAEAAGGK